MFGSHTGQMNGVQYSHTAVLHIFILLYSCQERQMLSFLPLNNQWTLKMAPKIVALNIQRIIENKRLDTDYDLISYFVMTDEVSFVSKLANWEQNNTMHLIR